MDTGWRPWQHYLLIVLIYSSCAIIEEGNTQSISLPNLNQSPSSGYRFWLQNELSFSVTQYTNALQLYLTDEEPNGIVRPTDITIVTDTGLDHCNPDQLYCREISDDFGYEYGSTFRPQAAQQGEEGCREGSQESPCYYPTCSFPPNMPINNFLVQEITPQIDFNIQNRTGIDAITFPACGLWLNDTWNLDFYQFPEVGCPYRSREVTYELKGEYYTISFTIEPETEQPNNRTARFLRIRDANSSTVVDFIVGNEGIRVEASPGPVGNRPFAALPRSLDSYNITAQFGRRTILLYVDGILTQSLQYNSSQGTGDFREVWASLGSNQYMGGIRNIRLYSNISTASEIYAKQRGVPVLQPYTIAECECPRPSSESDALGDRGFTDERSCSNLFDGSRITPFTRSSDRDKLGIFTNNPYSAWRSDLTSKADITLDFTHDMLVYAVTGVFDALPQSMEVQVGSGAAVYLSEDCQQEYKMQDSVFPEFSSYQPNGEFGINDFREGPRPQRRRKRQTGSAEAVKKRCFLWSDISSQVFLDGPTGIRVTAPLLLPNDEAFAFDDIYAGDKLTIKLRGHQDTESRLEDWYSLYNLQITARPHCGGYRYQPNYISVNNIADYYDFFSTSTEFFRCICPPGIRGERCEQCSTGGQLDGELDLYRYQKSPGVCADCDCTSLSESPQCDSDGQCPCKIINGEDVSLAGRQCNWYISDIDPLFGPVAGGTPVTMKGGYFSQGDLSATLWNDQLDINNNETTASFVTPAAERPDNITVTVDLVLELYPNNGSVGPQKIYYPYEYRPNPIMEDIQPRSSFLSGGYNLTVTGKFMDSVAYPEMIIYVTQHGKDVENYTTECVVVDASSMLCPTPNVRDVTKEILRGGRTQPTEASPPSGRSDSTPITTPISMTSSTSSSSTSTSSESPSPSPSSTTSSTTNFSASTSPTTNFSASTSPAQTETFPMTEMTSLNPMFNGSLVRKRRYIQELTVGPLQTNQPVGQGTTQEVVRSTTQTREPVRQKRQVDQDPSGEALNGLKGIGYTFGFRYDGYVNYTDLRTHSRLQDIAELKVFEDPVIKTLEESTGNEILEYDPKSDNFIRIEGEGLNWDADQWVVEIGKGECQVISVFSNQITCKPPSEIPEIDKAVDFTTHRGVDIPHIVVRIGNIRPTAVGYVYYKTNLWKDNVGFRAAMIVLIILVIIAILAALFYVLWRKRIINIWQPERTNNKDAYNDNDPSARYVPRPGGGEVDLVTPFLGKKLDEDLQIKVNRCNIPKERLQMERKLGKGNFGLVYKACLTLPNGNLKTVAVKTIKEDKEMSFEDLENFLAEGTLMIDFKHENVLSLVGVAYEQGDRPFVVLPYMENGDLCTFIRRDDVDLLLADLLHFAYQMANGMEYLAKERFVHRDLAARNCMVDGSYIVKIADFGMSRDVYEKDYYTMDNMNKPLPMKWMAVESLKEGRYTSKSDVWSYGITMWELLTRGSSPYPGVNNYYIKEYVVTGKRLDRPDICPPIIYEMMVRCWEENPDNRPTFSEISRFIKMLLDGQTKPQAGSTEEDGYSYTRKATKDIPEDYMSSSAESHHYDDYIAPLPVDNDYIQPQPSVKAPAPPVAVSADTTSIEMAPVPAKRTNIPAQDKDYINQSVNMMA